MASTDGIEGLAGLPALLGPAAWRALGIVAGAAVVGFLFHVILFAVIRRLAGRTESLVDDALLAHVRRPSHWLFPTATVTLCLPLLEPALAPRLAPVIAQGLTAALVVLAGWTVVGLLSAAATVVLERYEIERADNLEARKIHTQVKILKRIAIVVVSVLTFGGVLVTFDRARELGAGILASAGVAGIIIGFAAQKTLANLLAGVQIALSQPIRVDDVVVIEGEWGRIEEINLTYIVVRIWDLRRLVVPIGAFLEKPFQNWTRTSANLLATVSLWTDYTVPVDDVRDELRRILEESELWDGEVWTLQVVGASDRSIELRALMSAPDSATAWDLRCHVRERLLDFLQREHPGALPRIRASVEGEAERHPSRGS